MCIATWIVKTYSVFYSAAVCESKNKFDFVLRLEQGCQTQFLSFVPTRLQNTNHVVFE